MDEYPRPWSVKQRTGWWYVVDASDRIVAGPFGTSSGAWAWLERMTGGGENG